MNKQTDSTDKLAIREVIVVEGIHDKQALAAVVEAEVWVIGGDRVARRFLESLKRAAQSRGVIVLTDPDGPGERIRDRIAKAVPGVKHAFLPRKAAVSNRGIGVEHADSGAILAALTAAKPSAPQGGDATFTVADLMAAGLTGTPQAASRRQAVGDLLSIGYGNTRAFLGKLNALGVTREEFSQAVAALARQPEDGGTL